ncbi:hypothetical protein T492DRAFT_870482, partial [Pavlovales sp. CCMP2436]
MRNRNDTANHSGGAQNIPYLSLVPPSPTGRGTGDAVSPAALFFDGMPLAIDGLSLPSALGSEPPVVGVQQLPARAALAMLASSLGDGLTVLDGSGPQPLILYANRAFEQMSGFSLAELRASGLGLGLLTGHDTSVAALAQLSRAL